jgi:deoxyhypusine synthase
MKQEKKMFTKNDGKEVLNVVSPIGIKKNKSVVDFIKELGGTGFQGKALSKACFLLKEMIEDEDTTILFGYAGSLSTTGQSKIIQWLIENNIIDILVPTGANISEDIVEALGFNYYQGLTTENNELLFKNGFNRYHDVYGKEEDYYAMTDLIVNFILTLDKTYNYSSREFLHKFGLWLDSKNINSIVTSAARKNVPIFCPALIDSPYGDAALIAKTRGFNLCIDSVKVYVEFMSLSSQTKSTGVVYIGGGVPKDFIQLFAVSSSLLYPDFEVPNKKNGQKRSITEEVNYPHKYAIQITTDSPQWGGLSGCTFDEAVSWGKEIANGKHVQCFCDATIALPLIVQGVADMLDGKKRIGKKLSNYFE